MILEFGLIAGLGQTNIYLFTGSETSITLNPGAYEITAYGAQGGGGGGLGAEMDAQFSFTNPTTLILLVGGVGQFGGYGGGGGGGSFAVNGTTPLVVAGGGGGFGGGYDTGGSGGTGSSGGGGNGFAGGGGGSGGGGGGGVNNSGGAGGAGYSGNGVSYGGYFTGGGGSSFLNGGSGGYAYGDNGPGGYGGGGGAGSGGGGGGGGYSGGGGGTAGGGGGGSIIDSSAITILAGISGVSSPDDSPNGEIIITSVPQPPIFTEEPSLAAAFSSNVMFQTAVQGTAPLSFQWYLDGAPLSDNGHYIGSMETNLIIVDFQPEDLGNYTLVVTNYIGSITSNVATINILNPIITSQPTNQSALGGDTVTFSVSTTGQQPFGYQWLFNGTNLDGATNNPLILSSILMSQSGEYSVVVSNNYSTILSSNATLTVQAMDISSLSGNQTVIAGGAAQFSVGVNGQQPMYYQWLFNGTNLPNTDASILTLTNLQLNQAGPYSVIVTNFYGMATSSVVNLTVLPLSITAQPKPITAWPGGSATFTLTVGGLPPFTYQWLDNSNNFIFGNNTNSLVLSNLQASQFGNYSVIVTNNYESVTSSAAALIFSQVAVWGGANGESNLTSGLTNIIAISGGSSSCLALNSNGKGISWPIYSNLTITNLIAIAGAGPNLGLRPNGTVAYWNTFSPISGLTNIVAIAEPVYGDLALNSSGTVVGNASIAGLTNVVAIAENQGYSLALNSAGTVISWGNSQPGRSIPSGLSNVVAIAAGYLFNLALKNDGTVTGWGLNNYGQTSPPAGLSNVVAIAAGEYHSLALKSDGTVIGWGLNNYGQTNVPSGLTNVIAISAGQYDSLALIGSAPPFLDVPLSNPTAGTNSFSVSLPTQSGKVYVLQYKGSLTYSNWTALPLNAGNGETIIVTDTSATNSQRFYRVQQW